MAAARLPAPPPGPTGPDGLPLAHVFLFDDDTVEERRVPIAELSDLVRSHRKVWADVESPDRTGMVEALAAALPLHPIAVDVLLARDHRPSVDEFPTFAHVILELVQVRQALSFEKVDVLVGNDWMVTVQDRPGDCFEPVRHRLRADPSFRRLPIPYFLHALAESVCRDYLRVLDKFGKRLETLELRLIARPAPNLIHRIHAAKRDLRGFRRAVVPLRESIETFVFANRRRGSEPGASTAAGPCGPDFPLALREIHDELGGVIDILDAYRDATQNLTDLYLASSSNRVNEILRVLTIISTIFIPLSFVAGIYGMNFTHMPELGWRYGYLWALSLMAAMAASFLLYFWRKGWLGSASQVGRQPSITRTTKFEEEPPRIALPPVDEPPMP